MDMMSYINQQCSLWVSLNPTDSERGIEFLGLFQPQ